MNSRHDSLSGMGRRVGKARLMLRARDRQRAGDLTRVSKCLATRVPLVNYGFWSQACNSMSKQTLEASAKSVSQYTKLSPSEEHQSIRQSNMFW